MDTYFQDKLKINIIDPKETVKGVHKKIKMCANIV